MVNVHHIQYPVGQGGLHLGIIGSYAYIYDCGGDRSADWDTYFNDIEKKVSECKELYIFISHLHEDHYNHLSTLLSYIDNSKITVKFYLPYTSSPEKIIFVCDHIIQKGLENNPDRDDTKLQKYIRDVMNNINGYNTIQRGKEVVFTLENIIIKPYVTNISDNDIRRFLSNLKTVDTNIDIDDLANQINIIKDFWKKAVAAYKKTFHTTRISHKNMLSLYCGLTKISSGYDNTIENWLHTGDALMKTNIQIKGFLSYFGKLIDFVNCFQIPHHGSKYNQDWRFSIFCTSCYRKFYLTVQDNPSKNQRKYVTPDISDIKKLRCQKIDKYSEKTISSL